MEKKLILIRSLVLNSQSSFIMQQGYVIVDSIYTLFWCHAILQVLKIKLVHSVIDCTGIFLAILKICNSTL